MDSVLVPFQPGSEGDSHIRAPEFSGAPKKWKIKKNRMEKARKILEMGSPTVTKRK